MQHDSSNAASPLMPTCLLLLLLLVSWAATITTSTTNQQAWQYSGSVWVLLSLLLLHIFSASHLALTHQQDTLGKLHNL